MKIYKYIAGIAVAVAFISPLAAFAQTVTAPDTDSSNDASPNIVVPPTTDDSNSSSDTSGSSQAAAVVVSAPGTDSSNDSNAGGSIVSNTAPSNDSGAGGSIVPPTAPSNLSGNGSGNNSGGNGGNVTPVTPPDTAPSNDSGGGSAPSSPVTPPNNGGGGSPSITPSNGGGGGGGGGGNGPISTLGGTFAAVSTGGSSAGGSAPLPQGCNLLTTPLQIGKANDTTQVTLLQELLNKLDNANLTVTGIFDQATFNAVEHFQVEYSTDILSPWGATTPSGYVFITTRQKLNELNCDSVQPLTADELAIIAAFRNRANIVPNAPAVTAGATTEIGQTNTATGTDIGNGNASTTLSNQYGTLPTNTNTAAAANAGGVSGFFGAIGSFFSNLFHKLF